MSKLNEIIRELEMQNLKLIDRKFESLDATLVGVKMHPSVFHEVMSDKDSLKYIVSHLELGYNTINGYPIEINRDAAGYEIVQLSK